MANVGINQHDVFEAANQLAAQGKKATIESIRALIGTGSNTTINQHLKKWREQRHVTIPSPTHHLPGQLKTVWETLQNTAQQEAHEKIAAIQQETQEQLTQMQHALQTSEKTQQKALQQSQRIKKRYLILRKRRQQLRQEHQQQQITHSELKGRHEALEKQLAEQNQFSKNLLRNFETFQQASAQLQQEKELKFQNETGTLRQEIREFRQVLFQTTQERDRYRHQSQSTQEALERLTTQYKQLHQSRDILIQDMKIKKQQLTESQSLLHQAQKSWEELKTLIEQHLAKQQTLEKNNAVLDNQNQRLEKSLYQAEATIALLRAEKLELVQHQAALSAQLNQWQKRRLVET